MASSVNIRALALDVLIEINENDAYSHQILRQTLDKYGYLEKRDRAFLTRLVEGTLERTIELDAILDTCSKVPVKKMKPLIRNLLRMGVYQIRYMDSVPDSAACNESVKLARKRGFASLSGFVNGVLRSVIRQLPDWKYPDAAEEPVQYLSIRYSIPEWIVCEWYDHYGLEQTEDFLQAFYREYPLTVRTNRTKCTPQELAAQFETEGVNAAKVQLEDKKSKERNVNYRSQLEQKFNLDYVLEIGNYDRLDTLPSFRDGWFYVQDISSIMAAEFANPQPDDYVIDVCAAPGGKCTHIAEKLTLSGGSGFVEARDLSPEKVAYIEENIARLGLKNCKAVCMDATRYDKASETKADLLICDLPCSGLGVMGHKTDIRLKMTPEKQAELVQLQRQILDTVAAYVKPGGRLVYSTCTIHREENEANVAWFTGQHPEFTLDEQLQILPGNVGQDGFFMARLLRQDV